MSSYILCKIFSFKTRFAQKVLNTSGPNSLGQKNRVHSIFRTNAFVAPGHQQLNHLRPWQTRTHCCGHIVAHDVSLLQTQNVSEQNQKQMLRARANGETFVSATMCSQQCVLVCQGLYANEANIVNKDSSILDNPNKYVKNWRGELRKLRSIAITDSSTAWQAVQSALSRQHRLNQG